MKYLVLAMALLTSPSYAGGAYAYWPFDNNFLDRSGNGRTLNETGSVTFDFSPDCGFGNAEVEGFSVSDFMTSNTDFDTATVGDTTFTIEGYVYIPSPLVDQTLFSFYSATLDYTRTRVMSDGTMRLIIDDVGGGFADSAPGAFVADTCLFFAVTYEGSNMRGYVSNASSIDSTVDVTLSQVNGAIPGTLFLGKHGNPAGPDVFQGSYQNVLVLDYQQTSFPTTPPSNYIVPSSYVTPSAYITPVSYIKVN